MITTPDQTRESIPTLRGIPAYQYGAVNHEARTAQNRALGGWRPNSARREGSSSTWSVEFVLYARRWRLPKEAIGVTGDLSTSTSKS